MVRSKLRYHISTRYFLVMEFLYLFFENLNFTICHTVDSKNLTAMYGYRKIINKGLFDGIA